MSKELKIDYLINNSHTDELNSQIKKASEAYKSLISSKYDMTGWIDYPDTISDNLINEIKEMASKIRENYSALVIVGIGGSYLGVKAALDFVLQNEEENAVKIFYAGINLSTDYHERILRQIEKENSALLIISKSGNTMESLVAGNLFLDYLSKRYGEDQMRDRVYAITDPEKGKLRELVNNKGYASLPVPQNIGGRFSVLSPVGLLPMAVAGLDINEIINGAKSAMSEEFRAKAEKLAAVRNMHENEEYTVELFADFDPYKAFLIQWIKQLYGESEGKNGRGMFPMNLEYTKDLHSLGQFVQEGRQIFTETFISVAENNEHFEIPSSWGICDKDMTLGELNDDARKSVIEAHHKAGIPITMIELPDRSEYSFGQIIYFLQMSCAIRGIMMGVNPFDQPGVEKYKEEMQKCLKNSSKL